MLCEFRLLFSRQRGLNGGQTVATAVAKSALERDWLEAGRGSLVAVQRVRCEPSQENHGVLHRVLSRLAGAGRVCILPQRNELPP
jgi:hypothetical protein